MISFILSLYMVVNPLSEEVVQPHDICDVYGQIYVSNDPRRADFRVFIEDSEAFADLIIYKEENALYADRRGIWHFTKDRNLANIWIYIEKDRGLADILVYYTDYESFAGCNR